MEPFTIVCPFCSRGDLAFDSASRQIVTNPETGKPACFHLIAVRQWPCDGHGDDAWFISALLRPDDSPELRAFLARAMDMSFPPNFGDLAFVLPFDGRFTNAKEPSTDGRYWRGALYATDAHAYFRALTARLAGGAA